MKIIAIAAVTAGGKTTIVNELKKVLPKAVSLHFDDYSFEGEPEDFYQWTIDGADYNVYNLCPFKKDIESIIKNEKHQYLLLDYPFAYLNDVIKDYIDMAIFIDTPLDISLARHIIRDMKKSSSKEILAELDYYLKYARVAYVQMLQAVLPSSDYIINGDKQISEIVDEIVNIINMN